MKSEQITTAVIVLVAMLAGAGLAYVFMRPGIAPATTAVTPRPEPRTSITPPLTEKEGILDDAALSAAIEKALAARKAGTLKSAATPQEFARSMGAINFRLHDFAGRFPVPPADAAAEFAAYKNELDQLTEDLAVILSDEELMEKLDEDTPAQFALIQSHLAAGALALDDATTAKVGAILVKAYADVMPPGFGEKELSPAEEAEFEKKFETMTEAITKEISALLTPEQRTRFESMGVDKVLYGLHE